MCAILLMILNFEELYSFGDFLPDQTPFALTPLGGGKMMFYCAVISDKV